MIIKERKPPLSIQKLQVMLRRLPKNHPKIQQLQEEYSRATIGYRGEQALDYHLTFIEEFEHLILHNIRLLNSQKYYFQIDTLILTPYFILNLETKNISGTLFFDQDFHQLIRTLDEKEEAFPDPILQIQRQESQLKSWLAKNKVPQIPITSKVVISNPLSIIKTQSHYAKVVKEKVIHLALIWNEIEKLHSKYSVEIIPMKDLKKIARQLVKCHIPYNPNYFNKYQIKQSDILTGVHCPNCNHLPMVRMKGIWFCGNCKTNSLDAHINSIYDYSLLYGPMITNKQLRQFLNLRSISISNKLLNSLNCKKIGERKGRYYQLPELEG